MARFVLKTLQNGSSLIGRNEHKRDVSVLGSSADNNYGVFGGLGMKNILWPLLKAIGLFFLIIIIFSTFARQLPTSSAGILVLLALAISIWFFIWSRQKGNNKKKINDLLNKSIVDGFSYPWFSRGTGMAFNIKENKVLLYNQGLHKIYDRNNIRNVGWEIPGDDHVYYTTGGLLQGILTLLNMGIAKGKIRRTSGFKFEVADIDHPLWFVHCSNEREIRKEFEIIQQFLDGTLPVPASNQNMENAR